VDAGSAVAIPRRFTDTTRCRYAADLAASERNDWTVAEGQVDIDDGISGADFVRREGYLRLMNALKPRPSFQVLIMMEQSRLGRPRTMYVGMVELLTAAARPVPCCAAVSSAATLTPSPRRVHRGPASLTAHHARVAEVHPSAGDGDAELG
jgi:Resolvase, N terminal domain